MSQNNTVKTKMFSSLSITNKILLHAHTVGIDKQAHTFIVTSIDRTEVKCYKGEFTYLAWFLFELMHISYQITNYKSNIY